MNKNMVLGLVVLIIVIAGGWYLLAKGPGPSGNQPAAAGAAQTGSGTVGDLLAMGPSQCTVTVDENGNAASGTVYVANGKLSGDFATTVNGQEMHAYMINDGSNIYSWTDQSPQGVEMPVSTGDMGTSTPSQMVGNTTPAQYSCTPWAEDDSAFTPPSSVTFMSAGDMMAPGTTTTSGAMMH